MVRCARAAILSWALLAWSAGLGASFETSDRLIDLKRDRQRSDMGGEAVVLRSECIFVVTQAIGNRANWSPGRTPVFDDLAVSSAGALLGTMSAWPG